ncbi:DegV family protein [Lysobacter gummosus]|uniref:DegV family protein n=1 Tax=Lysobacter gummosus TaxID=262324 RepID=A0ABY3XET3_9GAMM|nr:DegV family protein [Lysobacter gummosus]ALN89548.1 EDD, DegV family domain protein [Lysobacter gummosus]UNP30186.1 DegV family protein [Lysobacter gummosus]
MRIGIVVDSACDLPLDYLQQNDIRLLPVTVRIGQAVLADHRNEQATLQFLHAHLADRGFEAETMPFSVQQIRDLFVSQLSIDYDYVFCMTITKTRSPIYENANQASFAILNDYRPVRSAAGINTPFSLRVIDTLNLFAAQGITAVEAVRLREAGEGPPKIRARLEHIALRTHGYLIPRDLNYLRARTRHRGDRSVSFLSATLGTALDIKPILHCNRGETGPVAKVKGYENAVRKLLEFAARKAAGNGNEGLLTPTVCLSYGGELAELHSLPGYETLRVACRNNNVELFESVMSLTGMVNIGKGALALGFAAEKADFEG